MPLLIARIFHTWGCHMTSLIPSPFKSSTNHGLAKFLHVAAANKSNQLKTNKIQTQIQTATNQTNHPPFFFFEISPSCRESVIPTITGGLRFCRLVGMRPYIFKAPKRKTWMPSNWGSPQQKQGKTMESSTWWVSPLTKIPELRSSKHSTKG